jgi:hypothetical protein
LARTAHAAAGAAAQDPADPGALAAQTAQGARVEYGCQVVDGFAGGGEVPIPQGGAPGAAMGGRQDAFELGRDGSVPGEERQQGEQELEQGRRKMDAIHRLRHAAQGVGLVRSGDSVWHHYKHYATQHRRATEFLPYVKKC